MLKLPTMPMEIFKKVLGNIDEKYPFSLSPKLILALLVAIGLCTVIICILFIWYKRKTSFTSTMGNILKLLPSLKENIPTLDSLLPILSEHVLQYAKNALTTIAVPQQPQTPMDKLVPPPILVPKLHITKPLPAIPYLSMEPQPSTSTMTNYKPGLISLEMFNHAAADLNDKGVINMKKYQKYLHKP